MFTVTEVTCITQQGDETQGDYEECGLLSSPCLMPDKEREEVNVKEFTNVGSIHQRDKNILFPRHFSIRQTALTYAAVITAHLLIYRHMTYKAYKVLPFILYT
jgi:hypothetical protein